MRSTGQRGELLVAEKLIANGWSVAHPLSDSSPFDLLVAKGDRFLRLQIKATLEQHHYPNKSPHYHFGTSKGFGLKKKYSRGEADFFVCVALDSLRFWIIPFKEIKTYTIKIYDVEGKWTKFEDAWKILEYDF